MRAILSIILIFQIIIGSINFNGEMHFCGNILQDIAFFGEAESCGDMDQELVEKTCSSGDHKVGFNKGNCCKDRKFSIQGISSGYELTKVLTFSTAPELNSLFFFEIKGLKGFFRFQNSNFIFDRYEPPIIFRNILTLFDTFLI